MHKQTCTPKSPGYEHSYLSGHASKVENAWTPGENALGSFGNRLWFWTRHRRDPRTAEGWNGSSGERRGPEAVPRTRSSWNSVREELVRVSVTNTGRFNLYRCSFNYQAGEEKSRTHRHTVLSHTLTHTPIRYENSSASCVRTSSPNSKTLVDMALCVSSNSSLPFTNVAVKLCCFFLSFFI